LRRAEQTATEYLHSDNLNLAHSDKSSDFVPLIRERRFLDPLSF
jgi:hypothetical protein